jgi:hypothetical protein
LPQPGGAGVTTRTFVHGDSLSPGKARLRDATGAWSRERAPGIGVAADGILIGSAQVPEADDRGRIVEMGKSAVAAAGRSCNPSCGASP